MPNRFALSVSALLFLVGSTATLTAQNLLANSNFDSGLSGWEVGDGASWDGTNDADGSPSSGSAKASVSFDRVGLTPTIVTQCIPVTAPGTRYVLGGKAFLPGGQAGGGDVEFSVGFFLDPSCSGAAIPGPGVGLTPPVTATDRWTATATTVTAFGQSARFAAFFRASSPGSFQGSVDDLFFSPAATTPGCLSDATTLCLGNLRFKVTATFDSGNGFAGDARAVPLTGDTGYFWFFSPANIEMVVKVIDGCGLGGHFWVFAGGLTNVKTTITVTDSTTGAVRTYTNLQGHPFTPIQDTSAFACP